MKVLRPILIFFGIIIAIIICVFLYIVTQISATYPPIKEYNYSLSTDYLAKALKTISEKHPNISYKLTDITGSKEDGKNYYMDIKIINVGTCYEYNIKYNA